MTRRRFYSACPRFIDFSKSPEIGQQRLVDEYLLEAVSLSDEYAIRID